MEEHRSVYFVDTDGKKKLLTDEIWNALSSGSDDDFDDSDEDPTFNPNVLFNRNSEDISDNNNDSESSENEVNIQNESSTSGNKTLEEKSKKVKKEKIKLVWKKKSLQVNPEIITFSGDTHVQQTPEKPLNVTSSDIRKYLGICILSSVSSVKDFRLYWNPAVGISLIQNSMPVNEFEKIRRYLHFNDNNAFSTDLQGGQDKFFKLRPLIDELQKSFLSIPMEECLCVDEQMCATKARHHLKQYMPDKPHKYGYKLFILSGVSGFAYNFEIYGGKELDVANILQEPDLGASSNVVIRLTRPVQENVNHKLYFDNYYTSIPLQVYLKKKGILSLGTIRRNRIPDCKLPTERELKLQVRGSITEFVAEYDGCELSNVSWKDNKTVTMLSTFAGTNPVSEVQRFDRKQKCHVKVNCPYVIKTYNKHMGGVDLLDSLIGRYKIIMRSKKWYFRLFYHLLDLTIINAWLLYKRVHKQKRNSEKPMKLVTFRLQLAETLCLHGQVKSLKRGRPSSAEETVGKQSKKACRKEPPKDIRFDRIDHWPEHSTNKQRCKMLNCKGFTRVQCMKCSIPLCFYKEKNCFRDYHLQ
ncbi:piggyBac transposable element-derived protein 2-like [Argiope bruennichi]|uniref:piggyBac transposable element-derived protein 2-like n=1 Tax=Argiope bruennichi TaxID=94029 RepID=UPI002494CAC2|nr:piggyBac transposable element-derived protein 2-like [Argiope bruennichi]XP_055931919.1 piggyBac transposable element-derived protein 2-like [Argiope bruennichi]XP_055932817.1 piggyBac transposable element-derived protein 2-like [Argiope bruennichi]XP_055936578.1 piggyBac transposable element-derived protein 2-like [Argiope bruennichi]XP_055936619.1 piggyBac transposable element-derived protein 2-like [Argiope bruennichi]XP_055938031.1 piggyBac transposable element-derived protein 2-like [A